MNEERQFYIDGLTTPLGYRWEIAPHIEEYYFNRGPGQDAVIKTRTIYSEWDLNLINEDNKTVITHRLNRLDDDSIRFGTQFLVEQFVARNRAKALEEGPVKITGESQ